MTKRIFAWMDGTPAEWYRVQVPFKELVSTGRWEVASGWRDEFSTQVCSLPDDIRDYDVVIGQRISGACPDWLELCADPDVLTVYEMDDDLVDFTPFHNAYDHYQPRVEETRRNIAAADVVTVCTPYVAEKVRKLNPNVHLLPICIPAEVLDIPLCARGDRLTVGWAGSPSHYYDWEGIQEQLAKFAARMPQARFHAMGADYTDGVFGERLRTTAFQPYADYYAALDFDVGIAPLRDIAFNHGKSHTKPLEYGARGVPIVATAMGQYRDWIKHGVNGFLVEKPSEWLEYLTLMADEDTRIEMSAAARSSARAYTIGKHIHLWERAYSGEKAGGDRQQITAAR